MSLDDPILDVADGPENAEWTPWKGLARATPGTAAMGILLALVTAPVAYYFPLVLTQFYIRIAFSFIATWMVLAFVEKRSGLVSWVCTALACGTVIFVLLSHHAIWAMHGVPSYQSTAMLVGWHTWMNPFTVLLITGWPLLIGGGFAIALHHLGFGLKDLAELLNSSVH